MESFFLAETTKYLYLLFDEDNFIHNTGGTGDLIHTPNGECIIDTGGYIFNSEAHPIDMAALYCCSAEKKEDDKKLQDFHDNLDLLALLDITDRTDTVQGVKWLKEKQKPEDKFQNTRYGGLGQNPRTSLTGDHQTDIGREGKSHKVDQFENVEITISGNKIHVTTKDTPVSGTPTVETKDIMDQNNLDNSEKTHTDGSCDKDSSDNNACAGKTQEETKKYHRTVHIEVNQGEVYSNVDIPNNIIPETEIDTQISTDKIKSDDDDEEEEEDEFGDKDDTKKDKNNFIDVPDDSFSEPIKKKSKVSSNIDHVLKLLQSFTSDFLGKGDSEQNMRLLHEKLKFYSLFQYPQPELMTCKAQPFYMSLSVMGEMFVENQ